MSPRYEYEFEHLKTTKNFWGAHSEEYQEVIRRRATNGWRFVQAYAPSTGLHGMAHRVDLIFERPVG